MLSIVKKAGFKEFMLTLINIFLLGMVGSYISYVLPVYKVAGHIFGVVFIGIYGYFVLKKYCAVITYEEFKNKIRFQSSVGSRTRETEADFNNVQSFSHEKPENFKIADFTEHILPRKSDLYIILKNDKENALKVSDAEGEIFRLLTDKAKG